MRSTVDGLRSLFARVPAPYVARTGGNGFDRSLQAADRAALQAAYGSVGTLFVIVSQLSTATAGLTWRLYRKRTDARRAYGPVQDDRTEIVRHQALNVLNTPNAFMPRQEFMEGTQQHVDLTGEGWWVVERPAGFPTAMWPVRPDRMVPIPDPDDFLAGYVYRSPDGQLVPLGLDEVIMIRMPSPLDPYRGLGPVQAILTDVDSAYYSAEWNRNFFMNSAEPGGIIEVEKSLSDTEFTRMVKRWRENHQGVRNAHRVAILEQGKWVDRQMSMKDMQFVQLRDVSREIIREAFAYPKFMLGEPEGSNRASAMAAEYVYGRQLIEPRGDRIRGALNNDYLPMFGDAAAGLEFDYDSPVPDDPEQDVAIMLQRAQLAKALLDLRVKPEQALEVAGLPPMDLEAPAPVPAQLQPADDVPADDDPEGTADVTALALGMLGVRLDRARDGRLNGKVHAGV